MLFGLALQELSFTQFLGAAAGRVILPALVHRLFDLLLLLDVCEEAL